jgi:MFS family permease
MADRSILYLTLVIAFFTLSSAVTGIFLPNYYLEIGLSINQITLLMGVVFITLAIVPVLTLKFMPNSFEKLLVVGVILSALFYAMLIYVKDPLLLGLSLGLSYATFWPAFNLLLFRFSDVKRRGLIVSMLYVAVPTIAGIIGPLIGGVVISFMAFNSLFVLSIIFLFFAFLFSLKIKYLPAEGGLTIPRSHLLLLFAFVIVMQGFGDVGFIAYPMFLHQLTGNFLNMGIITSVLSAIFAVVSLAAGKISKVEKHRITFTMFGLLMGSLWIISLSAVQNTLQLVEISILSGISSAFGGLLFSLYGDFFKRRQHATLVVLWEVFLMIGRFSNLIPVSVFIVNFDFKDYFIVVGIASLLSVAALAVLKLQHSKGRIKVDLAQ